MPLGSATSTRNGVTNLLSQDDFQVTVTDHWVSDTTGIRYPMAWVVRIPDDGVELRVTPVIRDSELDGRVTSYVVYWEGPVDIDGTHKGAGFVELSGYGGSPDGDEEKPVSHSPDRSRRMRSFPPDEHSRAGYERRVERGGG